MKQDDELSERPKTDDLEIEVEEDELDPGKPTDPPDNEGGEAGDSYTDP